MPNPINSHTQLSMANLFSNVIVTSRDNLRNNIADAFYKTEQTNDEMVSEIKNSMLNKTTDAFYKTEQTNDEMVKQMIESCVGRDTIEEKFERIEEEMQDLKPFELGSIVLVGGHN